MSRARNDLLSSVGSVLEILRILQSYGVSSDHLRAVLNDPQMASKVAEVLCGGPASLDDLIGAAKYAGKLDSVNPDITSANFTEVGCRGRLTPVNLYTSYGSGRIATPIVLSLLENKGLVPATVWELVHYALSGWDGQTHVVALGSVWRPANTDVPEYVGMLYATRGAGQLAINIKDTLWPHSVHVLGVRM